jgi:hypothetical protein
MYKESKSFSFPSPKAKTGLVHEDLFRKVPLMIIIRKRAGI